MPKGKKVHGVGSKEQRMYEHIEESAEKSGRYGKRAKEVAAMGKIHRLKARTPEESTDSDRQAGKYEQQYDGPATSVPRPLTEVVRERQHGRN